MKNPKEFVHDLKEHFYNKGKWLTTSQSNSFFDTIRAYLQKRNLVVVSKVEYETLMQQKNSN